MPQLNLRLNSASEVRNSNLEHVVREIASKVPGGLAAHDIYVCGSPAFLDHFGPVLKAAGAQTVYSEALKGHSTLPYPIPIGGQTHDFAILGPFVHGG